MTVSYFCSYCNKPVLLLIINNVFIFNAQIKVTKCLSKWEYRVTHFLLIVVKFNLLRFFWERGKLFEIRLTK